MALNGLASMVNPSLRLKDASINNTATKRLKLKVKLNLRNYHSPFSKINEYNAKINGASSSVIEAQSRKSKRIEAIKALKGLRNIVSYS